MVKNWRYHRRVLNSGDRRPRRVVSKVTRLGIGVVVCLALVGCTPLPPAPYQPIAPPLDPTKGETGYYVRPLYLYEGKVWFTPEGTDAAKETDQLFVEYKCLYDPSIPEHRRDCNNITQLALYRSAEVANERGYTHFVVLEHKRYSWCNERGMIGRFCVARLYSVSMHLRLFNETIDEAVVGERYDAKETMKTLQAQHRELCEHFVKTGGISAECLTQKGR